MNSGLLVNVNMPFYIFYSRCVFVYLFLFQIIFNFFIADLPTIISLIVMGPVNSLFLLLGSLACTYTIKLIPKDLLYVLFFSIYAILSAFIAVLFLEYDYRVFLLYFEIGSNFFIYYFTGRMLFYDGRWVERNIEFILSFIKPVSLMIFFLLAIKGDIAAILGFGSGDGDSSYLTLSDLFLFYSSIGVYYLFKSKQYFWLFFIILIQALMYSRTSFICLVAGSVIYLFWVVFWSNIRVFFSLVILVSLPVLLFAIFKTEMTSLLKDFRHLGWLVDRSLTTSLSSREDLLFVGALYLKNNYIFGNILWQLEHFNHTGKYIHNVMSYWLQYGIIGFCFLIYFATKSAFAVLFLKNTNVKYFAILLIAFLLELLISRSFAYPYVWMVFGIIIGLSKVNVKKGSVYENL
ncbi:MAG: hypothetical protein CML20_08890 [Rheinheimera sp.]|nr:hypothetical protein [Rheinheimera sp.]